MCEADRNTTQTATGEVSSQSGEFFSRLLRTILGTVLAVALAYSLADYVTDFIAWPVKSAAISTMVFPNPLVPVMTRLRTAGYAGLLLAQPFIVYQLSAFLFTDSPKREKRARQLRLVLGSLAIVCGVLAAYVVLTPIVLSNCMATPQPGTSIVIRLDEYGPTVLKMLLAVVVGFEAALAVLVVAWRNSSRDRVTNTDTARKSEFGVKG